MKKLLLALWIIIITGILLVFSNFSKDDDAPLPEGKVSENTNPAENRAETEVERDLTKNGAKTFEDYLLLGETYLKQNQPEKAEAAFLKAKNFKKNQELVDVLIAKSLINQRKIKEAKDIIWNLDKESLPEIRYYTGILLILYQDLEGAKAEFKKLAEILQSSEKQKKSSLTLKTDNFLNAYSIFETFKDASPNYLKTLLGKALVDNQEFSAAIPLLFDVITEENNYRDAWLVLGYAYLNSEKIPDAIDSFKQAHALDMEKPEALFFLGLAYFSNDEIDKAIDFLEQAKAANYQPKEELLLKLGDLYSIKAQYEKAAKNYENVISKNQSNLTVFTRAIWLNIDKLDNPTRALKIAILAGKSHPNEAMSYNLIGWSLIALNEYEKAEKYLKKALELDPKLDAANLNLGLLHEKNGGLKMAKEYYKKAFILGNGGSISNIAAKRFNNLLKVNISSP